MSAALLTLLIFIAALLYSSVGHGGASGYLAAMALFNVSPAVMKPTALVLNLFVAGIGTFRYARAGCFSWDIFWPFAVTSIPCAFLGGTWILAEPVYKLILGIVLLFAAFRMAMGRSTGDQAELKAMVLPLAIVLGAIIGLVSGLTGVGGGIFLSPLLLLLRWADIRKTAGISAAFIFVNSAAGLLGHVQSARQLPHELPWWTPAALLAGVQSVRQLPHELFWWTPAALLAGLIGAELGSRRLTPVIMRRLLAAVLVVAGVKMLLRR